MLDIPSRTSLSSLTAAANAIAPAVTLGFARALDAERVSVVYSYPHGIGEFVVPRGELPDVLSPFSLNRQFADAATLRANPRGVIEWYLLYGDVQRVESVLLPDASATRFWIGWLGPAPLSDGQEGSFQALIDSAESALRTPLSLQQAAERLQRLQLAADLLPPLMRVLDVRDVFDRLSEIARRALPHDLLVLRLLSPDGSKVTTFARTGGGADRELELPQSYPVAAIRAWSFDIIDDQTQHPLEMSRPTAKLGARSSLRLPLRFDDRVVGGLAFMSAEAGRFASDDVAVARYLADHVAIALSHHELATRLAEEARRHEQERARATNLELLDDLLATLGDRGELAEVFERISAIARKVLPHDALLLAVLTPDGTHARHYVSSGVDVSVLPEMVAIPEAERNPAWEFQLAEDLAAAATDAAAPAIAMGVRSALQVAIRSDERMVAALAFLANSPAAFAHDDVVVARRVADRVALSLSRERGAEAMRRADEATARAAKLEARVRALTDELDVRTGYRRVFGESVQWRQVLTQATQVASTEATVLLLGESGTGKEVVARFLHRGSPRTTGPFVALNCAALPEQLLEAELFGYERGAFTGATQSKPGQLEQAAGGTLFLDEVGEMSPSAQAKFLRVLQEREFQRLGGTRVLRTDVRVVAATNRDLQRGITNGQFREDLYYRLNVFAIRLPPLRDRRDDVLPLSEAFLVEIGRGLGTPPGGISRDARQLLVDYHWPGNVRELRNVLERASILCDGGLITRDHLALTGPPAATTQPLPAASAVAPGPSAPVPPPADSSPSTLQAVERSMIEKALREARFNRSQAAKALGLTRHQLYIRMRKHGIE